MEREDRPHCNNQEGYEDRLPDNKKTTWRERTEPRPHCNMERIQEDYVERETEPRPQSTTVIDMKTVYQITSRLRGER